MYEIESLPQLNLGRLGETGVTTIQIDISEWEALWPGISVGISMIAPGGGTPFLVAGVTADEADGVTYIEWAVGNDATALSGVGTIVVRGAIDSVVKRSVKADVIIEPGHPATGDPPDGYDSWMDDAIALVAAMSSFDEWTSEIVIAKWDGVTHNGLSYIWTLDTPGTGIEPPATGWLATQDLNSLVSNVLFTAHTILYATTSGVPAALTVAEQKLIGRLTGGNIAAISIGIADDNIVQMDDASAASGQYLRLTASGAEGRSAAEVLSDIGAATSAQGALADTMQHRNILHNWYFLSTPVNQRAASGDITSGYFYDRWMRYAGTITIAATYLSLPADASIEQRIEGLGLAGKVVSASVMVGGAVISGSGTFPTSAGTVSVTLTGFGTATLGYNASYMYVRFTATDSTRQLQAVKLELGSVSTLANDPPADYGEQLLKCQRYYQKVYGNFMCYATVADTLRVFFPLNPKMRINNPAIISAAFDWAIWSGAGYLDGSAVTIDSFSVIAGMDSGVDVAIIFTTSSLETTQKPYFSRVSAAFSADL